MQRFFQQWNNATLNSFHTDVLSHEHIVLCSTSLPQKHSNEFQDFPIVLKKNMQDIQACTVHAVRNNLW